MRRKHYHTAGNIAHRNSHILHIDPDIRFRHRTTHPSCRDNSSQYPPSMPSVAFKIRLQFALS